MRVDALNAVIRSIEGQEVRDMGFNGQTYFSDRQKITHLEDKSGLNRRYVGDGIAHMISIFTIDGQKRPQRLTAKEIGVVIDECWRTLFEVAERTFDISDDDALALFATDNFDWMHITPDMFVDVLRHFVATGKVVWLPPREIPWPSANLSPAQNNTALEDTSDV